MQHPDDDDDGADTGGHGDGGEENDEILYPDSDSDDGGMEPRQNNDGQQEIALAELMRDVSKVDKGAGLYRIALAQPHRDFYDPNTERQFCEWAIKSAILATEDKADPLVFVPDLPEAMQSTTRVARFREIPEIIEKIKAISNPDRIRGSVPPDEEIRKETKDLPSRFALKSYVRDSTQETASTGIVDMSSNLYGIYHGDGEQRWTTSEPRTRCTLRPTLRVTNTDSSICPDTGKLSIRCCRTYARL
ncbi:hypothetical protein P171DRAFT_26527 [Karstenula rhodostoma CBS 690.94]|uniref:Uncharacterized protein n=1 Tax=Karstenula rhodostoma CBS 690.94 TaxID=1392251 RepID=A0A9P4PIW1_9PLEO|nr:hypothetical protein P171DRAFT_26527 [Karstenula rhodostoma CBS 690.94]